MSSARSAKALEAFAELDNIRKARSRDANSYTEADVEKLVQEVREELEPEREPKRTAARAIWGSVPDS